MFLGTLGTTFRTCLSEQGFKFSHGGAGQTFPDVSAPSALTGHEQPAGSLCRAWDRNDRTTVTEKNRAPQKCRKISSPPNCSSAERKHLSVRGQRGHRLLGLFLISSQRANKPLQSDARSQCDGSSCRPGWFFDLASQSNLLFGREDGLCWYCTLYTSHGSPTFPESLLHRGTSALLHELSTEEKLTLKPGVRTKSNPLKICSHGEHVPDWSTNSLSPPLCPSVPSPVPLSPPLCLRLSRPVHISQGAALIGNTNPNLNIKTEPSSPSRDRHTPSSTSGGGGGGQGHIQGQGLVSVSYPGNLRLEAGGQGRSPVDSLSSNGSSYDGSDRDDGAQGRAGGLDFHQGGAGAQQPTMVLLRPSSAEPQEQDGSNVKRMRLESWVT
ncbi:unnamed protein product [Pleuronectes platessa]|uniref:Uncharacterized protein n=1 Tax=Pleuronectes platessa TaxID=8262 RepID=A0A9N7VAG4_PLEPL|nr:unnamed protein product [Pleuronectes platessa]